MLILLEHLSAEHCGTSLIPNNAEKNEWLQGISCHGGNQEFGKYHISGKSDESTKLCDEAQK